MPASICSACGLLNLAGGTRHRACQTAYRRDAYGAAHKAARRTLIEENPDAQCAICGSRENLQLDHVDPVRGGRRRNTLRYQVLCQVHNRGKG